MLKTWAVVKAKIMTLAFKKGHSKTMVVTPDGTAFNRTDGQYLACNNNNNITVNLDKVE